MQTPIGALAKIVKRTRKQFIFFRYMASSLDGKKIIKSQTLIDLKNYKNISFNLGKKIKKINLMGKVLLTRPIFDALETSDILKRYNIQSLCTPLIEIKKIPYEILSFSDYDIFLFTSKNAVRNFRINKK